MLIHGGAFAFKSTPWLITLLHHIPFNANRVKTRVLQSPLPWNNTLLSVPILRKAYTIYTSKISKFCRSVLRSIIYLELSWPSPLASTSFSCWFWAFSSSTSLGTLWMLPSWCSLVGQFRRQWCPPLFQHFTSCFIFTGSISFESSCLERFLMDRLDECPIIDPLSFPLRIAPRRIFTSFC